MTGICHAKYRQRLPQRDGGLFLTDGGLETTLIFHDGLDLPMFASFVLTESERGRAALRAYFDRYTVMAVQHGIGFILESPTWRANPDWGQKLGYDRERLARANRAAIAMMHDIRRAHETARTPLVISGNIGPRGDGYDPGALMSPWEAEAYHAWQIGLFKEEGADLVSAFTLTNVNEAIGVARAAKAAGMPCVISFTLETDGLLPTGESLATAIEAVDRETDRAPAYYMINCAHPDHFSAALQDGAGWTERVRGIRANASRMSHAELDNSTALDAGDPHELGALYAGLLGRFPRINVLGGCCGTDHRHVACISASCGGSIAPRDWSVTYGRFKKKFILESNSFQ
jgi:S-methylmethionine-dependent homocysteine/selenocysteine methylase